MDYPFKTDGCSWSLDLDQKRCCIPHDWDYWIGGTIWDKFEADLKFAKCIWNTSKYWYTAPHRFIGVTFGGWLPNPNFRWGYGWKFPIYKTPKNDFSKYTIKSQLQAYRKILKKVMSEA